MSIILGNYNPLTPINCTPSEPFSLLSLLVNKQPEFELKLQLFRISDHFICFLKIFHFLFFPFKYKVYFLFFQCFSKTLEVQGLVVKRIIMK